MKSEINPLIKTFEKNSFEATFKITKYKYYYLRVQFVKNFTLNGQRDVYPQRLMDKLQMKKNGFKIILFKIRISANWGFFVQPLQIINYACV